MKCPIENKNAPKALEHLKKKNLKLHKCQKIVDYVDANYTFRHMTTEGIYYLTG